MVNVHMVYLRNASKENRVVFMAVGFCWFLYLLSIGRRNELKYNQLYPRSRQVVTPQRGNLYR